MMPKIPGLSDDWVSSENSETNTPPALSGFVPAGPAPSPRSGMLAAEDKDPDRYGKVLTLADKFNLPVPAVEDRYDVWDYMSGVSVHDDLQNTHPATASVLSDPSLAAVAKDDVESLKHIEETLGYARRQKATAWMDSDRMEGPDEEATPVRDWLRKTFPDTYKAWLSGWVQEEMSRYGSQAIVGKQAADFDERVPQLKQAMQDLNAKPLDGFFEKGYLGAVQMLPQFIRQAEVRAWGAMAGGALGAALTPYVGGAGLVPGMIAGQTVAGVAYGFDLEGGMAYLDFKDIRDSDGNPLPDGIARVAAGIVGTINGGIESAQFTTLAKLFPGVGGKALVKESVARAALSLVGHYGKAVLTESIQETAQKLTNLVVEDLAKTFTEKTSGQKFTHATAQGMLTDLSEEFTQSVGTFAFLGVPGTVASIKPSLDAVRTSQRNADLFNALNDSLDGNVTRERYSPAIRALVEQVRANASVSGEEIGQIGIPASALDTLFQSDPGGLQEFLQAAEVEPGAFSKALDQESDVEIPLEVFAQKVAGTETGRKLVNDLRLFPSDSTVNEAKRESEYLKTVLEQRATEGLQAMSEDADLKAEVERIKQGVKLEGMDAKDVDAQLAVLAARAKVSAQRWGVTPAEWIRDQLGLKVEKGSILLAGDLEQRTSVKPWPDDSPKATIHTTIGKLREHPDHTAAKAGDAEAAIRLIEDLIKPDRIAELGKQYPDAMVVSIHAIEESGKNQIPRRYANAISQIAGLPLDTEIFQTNVSGHTKKDTFERLLSRADFDGNVRKGQKYIIADDAISSGGTIAGLRHYIENNGGQVVAVTGLTAGKDATRIPIKPETIQAIEREFGREKTEQLLRDYDISGTLDALTDREGRYILSSSSLDAFRNRIVKAGYERGRSHSGRPIPPSETEGVTLEQIIFDQQQQEEPLGSVTFSENQTIIRLFKSANYSTFLHEIGHVFMHDLESLVAADKATDQDRADLEALRQFVSDQSDSVAQQEKLARAFETYLLEGKAPTEELRGAFARYRGWLIAIYRSLKSVLGVEINDEIRGVFDRMLQAEDDIKAAETYHNARSSMDALIDEVATDAEKARIEHLKQKLSQDAIAKRTSTLLKAYFKAIGGRGEFARRAANEIEEQPVYQALKDSAENGGIRVTDENDQAVRTINKRHGHVASESGALVPEIFAAKHGFNSAEEMLKAMRRAESLKTAVNRRAKELFKAEEAKVRKEMESEALSEQHGITFPGDAEFHGEAALDVLLAEAELLRRKRAQQDKRKTSATRITAQALRDKIRADLGGKPVRDALRYDRASSAESRAARAAETAFRKGDIEEALRQKQLQAYYHAIVLESVRARDDMAKFERKVSRFLRGMDSIEHGHREQFLAVANRYGLTERSPKDPQNLSSFEAFVTAAANEDPNGVPMFSPWLLRGEKAGSYRGLSLDEARELRAAIEWVVGRGSDQLQQMLTMESISIATYADKAQRLAHGVKPKPVPAERSLLFNIRRKIRGGLSKISQAQFYLMAMDGYKNQDGTSPGMNEGMFRWLADAGSREKKIYYAELWPEYEKAFKRIREAQKRIEAERGTYFDIKDVPVTPAMEQVGATSWTSERVIAAALNMGNEGNLAAMLQGYGLSMQQLQSLVSVLTEDDWSAIQGIWDLIDTQYAPMDEAYFKINNIHTKKVQATPFEVQVADPTTLTGLKTITVSGGYYPLIFDHKLSDRAEAFRAEDLLKNSEMAVTHSPAARSGFTNARTGGLLPPKLSLGVISQHLYDTVHYYTHAAAVRDVDRITRVPEWKQEFIRLHGREAYAEIRPWLKSVIRPERAITDVYDDFLTRQRMLASIAVLGFNLKSASKQMLDFFAAMRDLGPIYVGRGVWSSWGNWSQAAEEVRSLSSYMAERRLSIDREMREVIMRSSPGKRTLTIHGDEYSWSDVERFSFKFIEMADAAVTIPVWKAAYAKASDLRMPPEECIKYADNTVRVTQPGADLVDMVALQRSQNWTRLFSMFISPGLRVQNRMRYFWGAWRNGQMDADAYFGHVLYELVAPSVVRWAFYAAFLGALPGDDDDDRNPVSDIAFNFLDQAIGGFPVVNTIPSMIQFGRGSPSPAMEGLTRIYKFAGSGVKAVRSIWDDELTAEEEWTKFAAATADAITFEMGVGYAPRLLKTFAEGFEDLFIEDRTVNPLRMIIKVPRKDRE
jgi:hypothetical protein